MAVPTPNGGIESEATSDPTTPTATSTFSVKKYLSNIKSWETWRAILLGQIVSILNCATGVISQYLSSIYNVEAPTAQSFFNYVLLCMVYTTWLACLSGDRGLIPIMRTRGWKYFILALIDVEGNYLFVKAYSYTSLTSIQLLDCFTIAVCLALSWIVLKVRYQMTHILGVGICLLGLGCVVWADVDEGADEHEAHDRLVGDMLCLAGATLYGFSNIGQEFTVKTYDGIEFLGMIGLFGSVINGIQLAVLERQAVAAISWDVWQIDVLLVSFSIVLFMFYSLVSKMMKLASATAFNLSILSCDFYSLVVGVFVFHYSFQLLYLLSFSLVILGVIVYYLQPTASIQQSSNYSEVMADNPEVVDLSMGTPESRSNSIASAVHGCPQQITVHDPPAIGVFPMKLNGQVE